MKKVSDSKVALLLVSLFLLGPLFAGGPNILDFEGGFLRWSTTRPVPFSIDKGPLKNFNGQVISNEDGIQLVREQALKWNQVPSAAIELEEPELLPLDINGSNWQAYFADEIRPENPVVFDADGSITSDLLGEQASGTVLGFAGIRFSSGNEFLSGWAVLNGKRASTGPDFRQTVLHELGHFLGLDHAQGVIENFFGPGVNLAEVPLMFPFGGDPSLPGHPIADDIAWLSWMYPEPGFEQQTGTIRGRVFRLRQEGPPMQGANVVAVPAIPDGQGGFEESRENVTSVVSDFLAAGTGEFELPGLEPGTYFVFIDRLERQFVGGSGIGPFDERPTNFQRDYFSEEETFTDDRTVKTVIEVAAGQTVEGIDFVANEQRDFSVVRTLLDDDAALFSFPEGFVFPFFGKLYREIYVNSDGNLTFHLGDARPGEPRSEDRFLSGPPRIAPLFTDLDPSFTGGGTVTGETGPGFVKFSWDSVPEFWDSLQGPGPIGSNSFTVTLFSSGAILFEYEQISVTPDASSDTPDGLQAIIGISPGGAPLSSGEEIDFSSPGPLEIPPQALYQVFSGETLDLQDRSVLIAPSLLFPLLRSDDTKFTGIAISNFGEENASLTAEARGSDGLPKNFSANPAGATVESGTQLAQLARELFDVPWPEPLDGWIEIASTSPELASFFQFGETTSDFLTKLDGSTAFTETSQTLYFTRIYEGPQVFQLPNGSPQDAATWLSLVNPNDEPIGLTLRIFNPAGLPVVGTGEVQRTLSAKGRLFERVGDLFNLATPLADGFVEVEVDAPGAIGFELIELPNALLGLNAHFPTDETTSYSAQLARGEGIFTTLKLVNPAEQPVLVTVSAFLTAEDGTVSEVTGPPFTLGRKSTRQGFISQFLPSLPQNADVEGSLRIQTTDGSGIVGDVVFGDPATARFVAALPLQTRLLTRAIHSQVSNGVVSGNPSLSSFTGLAFFNPNDQSAEVQVRVFDRDGVLLGETTLSLEAGQRFTDTVGNMIPETVGLVRGYIEIESDRPIVAQQLFGNNALDYLSAVLPAILE